MPRYQPVFSLLMAFVGGFIVAGGLSLMKSSDLVATTSCKGDLASSLSVKGDIAPTVNAPIAVAAHVNYAPLGGSLQFSSGLEHGNVVLNNSVISIQIQSMRSQCQIVKNGPTEACVYRVFAKGQNSLSATFCSPIKLSNGTYICSLPVILSHNNSSDNSFRLLVVLESLANSSDYGLLITTFWGALATNGSEVCVGVKVLGDTIRTSSASQALEYTSPVFEPKKDLPLCSFKERNIDGNDFIWVRKDLLPEFTHKDALIIPHQKDRIPIMQEYVWFPRGCRQPWLDEADVEVVAQKVGGLDIVFLGSSRIRDTFNTFATVHSFNASTRLYFSFLNVWVPHNVFTELQRILAEQPWLSLCSQNSSRMLVVVLSADGIWAARGHEGYGPVTAAGIFRFYENLLVRVDYIREICRLRKLKIVLATDPQVHTWDLRTPETVSEVWTAKNTMSLFGPRIEVGNWGARKIAHEQDLLIADIGSASHARREAVVDNVHYDDPELNISTGTSLTFAQLMLAAALEATKS